MEQLNICPLENLDVLLDFNCGVEKLDTFIHGGLRQSVENSYCKVYGVYSSDNILVAFFALSFDSLQLDDADVDDLQQGFGGADIPELSPEYLDTFWSKVRYPAIEISYLAVAEKYRNKNIGRTIIESIARMARNQKMAGCQFLTVDALATKEYSAVGFYSKCHFAPAQPVPVHNTMRMYYTLLT